MFLESKFFSIYSQI